MVVDSPFHYAAKNGHNDVVLTLLRNVANILTPPHEAAKNGNVEVVRALLEYNKQNLNNKTDKDSEHQENNK